MSNFNWMVIFFIYLLFIYLFFLNMNKKINLFFV